MILGSAVASTGAFAADATAKVADTKPATTVSKPAVKSEHAKKHVKHHKAEKKSVKTESKTESKKVTTEPTKK